MLTSHRSLVAVLVAVLLLVCAGLLVAQEEEPEGIYVANTRVITIRDKAGFPSIIERARAIDRAISQVIATQDVQNPNITVKEVGGLWTVYAWDTKIVSVTPAEAKANNLPAKSLAAVWAKNLNEALPRAAKGPSAVGGTGAAAVEPAGGEEPAEVGGEPPMVVTGGGRGPSVPAGEVTRPPRPRPVVGAPTLLVRDAFDTVRALSEEEYVAKRDELVSYLIQDLTPFITGKIPSVAGGTPAAATIGTGTGAATGAGTPVSEPATPSVVRPPATGGTTRPAPRVTTPGGAAPAARNLPTPKAGDPSYARVPQKNRIREKLERARTPYLALRREDPEAARAIEELLAACRQAYARGNYDESEQYVDSALERLGIRP